MTSLYILLLFQAEEDFTYYCILFSVKYKTVQAITIHM